MKFEADCCIFVGMRFYRNAEPSFPTVVFLSRIRGNYLPFIFSLMLGLARRTELSGL